MILPPRKPPLPPQVTVTLNPPPPGSVISKNTALAIAIEHAPPSRDMDVTGRMVDGRRAYAVTFKTEAGSYEVLIDAETGNIMKK